LVSVFDVYSVVLLLLSLGCFVVRYVKQDPPITPYLVIACVCAVGNWLGDNGGGWAAIALMTAASFPFLSCVLAPMRDQLREGAEARRKVEADRLAGAIRR